MRGFLQAPYLIAVPFDSTIMIKKRAIRTLARSIRLNRQKLVYPANDASPAVTAIPILLIDAPVQFRNGDKSSLVLVLGQ